MQFRIVHDIPGRIRFRAERNLNLPTAEKVADALYALGGVEGVRISLRTRSILLLYENETARTEACALLAAAPAIREERRTPDESSAIEPGEGNNFDWSPLLRYLCVRPFLPMPLRIATALWAALPFFKKGAAALASGRLNVDVLDATAIGVSALRRDFKTVSLLALLLGMGESLEAWTRKKSLQSLTESLVLNIDTVWIRRDGREQLVHVQDLAEGDLVVVRAGGAIPVDGVVESGEASVNQASMTGEPLGVLRAAGASVFAGTVVEQGELLVRPTGVGDGTRLRQIIRFIEQSESVKAGVQGKAEHLADAVVPFSFLLAGLVWMLTRNPARAASVLLVDYSCALRLATPLAILAAMKEGVEHGVLIKGGRFLEALASADTVVFDKTGTLTESRPSVVEVIPAQGITREAVLKIAACLEEHFPHPVARAVVRRAEAANLHHLEEHTEVEYVVAHGIASHLNGKRVLLGSRHYIHHDEGVDVGAMQAEIDALIGRGLSILYLAIENVLAGLIGIEDPLRGESREVIQHLRERGIDRILMLTGDDERTAAAVATALNIDEYHASVLPTDKARIIQTLKAEGRTVIMIGDGINDSPGLSAADVGVTLRDGADLAQEVADVVLTECRLEALVTAIDLGRAALGRIHTNFYATMGLNTAFLAGGLTGVLQPGLSAVCHNVTTVGISLSAMRRNLPAHKAE